MLYILSSFKLPWSVFATDNLLFFIRSSSSSFSERDAWLQKEPSECFKCWFVKNCFLLVLEFLDNSSISLFKLCFSLLLLLGSKGEFTLIWFSEYFEYFMLWLITFSFSSDSFLLPPFTVVISDLLSVCSASSTDFVKIFLLSRLYSNRLFEMLLVVFNKFWSMPILVFWEFIPKTRKISFQPLLPFVSLAQLLFLDLMDLYLLFKHEVCCYTDWNSHR